MTAKEGKHFTGILCPAPGARRFPLLLLEPAPDLKFFTAVLTPVLVYRHFHPSFPAYSCLVPLSVRGLSFDMNNMRIYQYSNIFQGVCQQYRQSL